METNCTRCKLLITGRQKHIQHLDNRTHPGDPIRDYHFMCEPKVPTGWDRWDTIENALSKLFQIG